MICVSIGRGRHKHVIAEHKHLVEQGAQLVELRLDYVLSTVNIKRLVGDRPSPVVITCRREKDGGKWSGSEEDRRTLLRSAIAEGVEYIDLEEDIAGEIPRFGKTKRIVSYHDFNSTPENLEALHTRMAGLDPDVIKIACMGHSIGDNLRCLNLMRLSDVPTVAICMGEIGTPSRILAARFGAPFTYATFHHERSLAPGQLSFKQMTDIYHYDKIDRETDVYGVIADPIGHTHSPVIHNAAFRQLGLNKVYVPFRVPREDLDTFLEGCREMGVKGLSVTIPHKEAVIRRLSKVDGAVRGIGACNTVVFDEGEAHGYNTDYRAAMDSLDAATGSEGERPLAGKRGAGPRRRRRGQSGRLRPDSPRRRCHHRRPHAREGRRTGRPDGLPGRPLGRSSRCRRPHPRQRYACRHAPQRRRLALRQAPADLDDDRFRHGV